MAGEDSPVLVAVAVADHDFLERAGPTVALLQVAQGAHGHGVGEEVREHAAGSLEVIDGLEERRDGDFRHKALERRAYEAGFASE